MGVPVAASDIPAHREACGSHAVYYDPRSPRSLASAVSEAVRLKPSRSPNGAVTWADNAAAVVRILGEAARGTDRA
jgi:hypothetical protein